MRVMSGTPDTRTEHSTSAAAAGMAISVGVPAAIALVGIAVEGRDAIFWWSAIVWGIVATAAFTLVSMVGNAIGVTRMDLLDLLGSMFTTPHTTRSRTIGAVIHHMNGALLAIAWAYGAVLLQLEANWLSGLLWGVVLWPLALLLMTSIGAVHPAIRAGREEDPGAAATNFSAMTPAGSLAGHLVYGVVLGGLYQAWPLS